MLNFNCVWQIPCICSDGNANVGEPASFRKVSFFPPPHFSVFVGSNGNMAVWRCWWRTVNKCSDCTELINLLALISLRNLYEHYTCETNCSDWFTLKYNSVFFNLNIDAINVVFTLNIYREMDIF